MAPVNISRSLHAPFIGHSAHQYQLVRHGASRETCNARARGPSSSVKMAFQRASVPAIGKLVKWRYCAGGTLEVGGNQWLYAANMITNLASCHAPEAVSRAYRIIGKRRNNGPALTLY